MGVAGGSPGHLASQSQWDRLALQTGQGGALGLGWEGEGEWVARAPGMSHVVGAGTTGAGSGEQREAGCGDPGARGSVGLGGPAAGGRAGPAQGRWAGAGEGPPWRSSWKILLRRPPLGPAFGQAGRQWVVGLGTRAASPFVPRPQLPPTPFPGLRGSEARVPLPGRGGPGRPGGVPLPLSPLDSDSCPAGLGQAPALGSDACARPPPPACASCFL